MSVSNSSLAKAVLAMLFFLVISFSAAYAQQLLGLSTSNFAGTNSIYANPSSIADSRHKFYFSLVTADISLSNNYFRYGGPHSPFKFVTDDIPFEEEYIKENLNGKPKLLYGSGDFRGPSFMLRLNPRHSIGFFTRFRAGLQVNNLSENLAKLIKIEGGGDAEELLNKVSDNNTFNLNANAHAELGFTYALVLLDKDKHFLKGGVTVKRLAGAYSAYFNNGGTKFKLLEEPLPGGETEYVLDIERIDTQYGYLTEDAVEDITVSDVVNMFTDGNVPGKGWGGDIGFTYEYRPDYEKYRYMMDGQENVNEQKNKYKFRVGVSLLDVGAITYNNPSHVRGYNVVRNNVRLRLADFDGASNADEFAEVLNESLNITDADKITSFTSSLPTALNLNVDYHLAGPLYINSTIVQGLKGKEALGMRQNSLVAITPRAELKYVEAAFPVALMINYSILTVGAMLRVGPLFVGSDNIGGAFNLGDPYGANVYFGLSVLPLLKKNKKDKDKDGVSNKLDKCKTVPGTLALYGCPEPPLAPSTPAQPDTTASPIENATNVLETDTVMLPPVDSMTVTPDVKLLNSPANGQESASPESAAVGNISLSGNLPADSSSRSMVDSVSVGLLNDSLALPRPEVPLVSDSLKKHPQDSLQILRADSLRNSSSDSLNRPNNHPASKEEPAKQPDAPAKPKSTSPAGTTATLLRKQLHN